MSAKFQKLKEELRSLEEGEMLSRPVVKRNSSGLFRLGLSSPKWLKTVLLGAFLGTFFLYAGIRYSDSPPAVDDPVAAFGNWVNQPDEDLLSDMGSWMKEMGYPNLSREELIELRRQGVTATFTSRMHDLGYTDLGLEQLIRLRQNDVSSTFAAMMRELGYDLSVAELIELRQHDVTAHYTSNLHDLGYTGITQEELIRLRDTGVEISEVKTLIDQSEGRLPPLEELIRHHISNQ